ncbi:MAG: hypothetical protein SFY67_01825 [Candidatus Melainabacteria bacterium]|nr:hypothetical protein [Candidatus Melainabacteria bacterium]
MWQVWRLDDNGNEFMICTFETQKEAQDYCDEMTARGHKQTYWCIQAN